MTETLYTFFSLTRLNKPAGLYLLLWPTLSALWLATVGHPPIYLVIVFVLGVLLMRSAGCIINDIWDQPFDAFVARTRERALVAKKISVRAAVLCALFLVGCAFLLVCQLNGLTIQLSFVALLSAIIYPSLKRFMQAPQLGLSIAFSLGVPMAFAAVQNSVPGKAWYLFCTMLVWPLIYDTLYAMADRVDDQKIGIQSLAILLGHFDKMAIGILQSVFLLMLIGVGLLFKLHVYYYLSLTAVAVLFVYQQILVIKREPQRCWQAFVNNQWVGLSFFLGIVLNYL